MNKLLPNIAASLVMTQLTHAHSTGHEGSVAETVSHMATHPSHWLPLVAGLAITVAAYAALRSRKQRRKQAIRVER